MRTIGVVTTSRADYGIYMPLLKRINSDPDLRLHLIVSGMHLSPEFGLTVQNIEADGFEIAERVEMLLSSDSPEGIAKSVGLGVLGFAQAYARYRPDILIVLGDRFEMHAAVVAAVPFKIPIAHLHGGELTEALMDDAIRHSITKLSHLHFVSTETYRHRLIQMGELPERVFVSGAPSLDNLNDIKLLTKEETENQIKFPLAPEPLLVTFHPVTLEYEETADHVRNLLDALHEIALPVIFTSSNADTMRHLVHEQMEQYTRTHENSCLIVNLGTQLYFSLMQYAAAMVGNSSSGIIEAASFRLPVLNIGDRQRGRVHGKNVIDVPCLKANIKDAIIRCADTGFKKELAGFPNPYGDGKASDVVVRIIKSIPLGNDLIIKRFYNLSSGESH